MLINNIKNLFLFIIGNLPQIDFVNINIIYWIIFIFIYIMQLIAHHKICFRFYIPSGYKFIKNVKKGVGMPWLAGWDPFECETKMDKKIIEEKRRLFSVMHRRTVTVDLPEFIDINRENWDDTDKKINDLDIDYLNYTIIYDIKKQLYDSKDMYVLKMRKPKKKKKNDANGGNQNIVQ